MLAAVVALSLAAFFVVMLRVAYDIALGPTVPTMNPLAAIFALLVSRFVSLRTQKVVLLMQSAPVTSMVAAHKYLLSKYKDLLRRSITDPSQAG